MPAHAAVMRAIVWVSIFGCLPFALGCSGADTSNGSGGAPTYADALSMQGVAGIALGNVGKGACSTNSGGGYAYDSSCSGNGGRPEYWCADFVRWVWAEAGADTSGLSAAAGSFYTYGQAHGTLHDSPRVGDAVVFNYQGGGYADHVAIVTQVNGNGTIESVSGDWDGENGSEATFSSTSRVVVNAPAYEANVGDRPSIIGMTISGYISPAGSSGGNAGGVGVTSGGGGVSSGANDGAGCHSATLGRMMPENACVENAERAWYQCDNGDWTGRFGDPVACNGVYPY